ncbi:class I SAM-dependent methyltransferase [Acetivibrio thermocellus]|uniref:class I SAM-dependent methyltransferase n=1 Tax=Acetivibrio thermocellus TaxID=1515 RepID=UPI001A9B4B83|nr:class I SAM-dependent methyltransferase [Acetivibrio thermocellus]
MSIKWEQEWDRIYKEQGEVQSEILPTVKVEKDIFKSFGCKKVMDLGCGTGRHTIYLAQNGYQVFAVDISETGIEVTRAKAEKLNLTNIEFAQLDMRNLSVDDNLMDAIMCVWTSGHGTFEDARKNLKEMYRILRLGEILVIDYVSREDENYGKGTEIEKNTFINNVEGEENIPHHYFAKEEIEELYTDFSDVDINPVDYYFTDSYGTRHTIKAFVVIAVK